MIIRPAESRAAQLALGAKRGLCKPIRRAIEILREQDRARGSQREPERARKGQRELERAREKQSEPNREPERARVSQTAS